MTNENNKSDYNEPFMDLIKYLPEPYKSDVNQSLIANLFNRFLSKQEIDKVSGYIGTGNNNAVVSRQIKENDVHRQAFQLQPILNNKVGSIDHMASWEDIQNELERLGVDMDEFAQWGAVQKFNWVPPIDINKIINYKDYYWVDDNNGQPQYITIRSRCAVATSRKVFWEDIIKQYGSEFPVVDILHSDNDVPLESFDVASIIPTLGQVEVKGDATSAFSINQFLEIVGTTSNNGPYEITSIPSYDGTIGEAGTTRFIVSGMQGTVLETNIGRVTTRSFDKIVFGANDVIINGDYTDLMEDGFIVFLSITNNADLNNTFVKILDSTADFDNNTTTVTIESAVTNDNFNAASIGSLNEELSIFTAAYNCQCGVLAGFDDGILWDDNPESPLWGDSENAAGDPLSPDGISDHQNLLDRITNPGPPVGTGGEGELWYDNVNQTLNQYSTSTAWKLIWNRFDLLLEATTGTTLWDLLPSCDTTIRIPAADQWISENKWQHRNTITNFAAVRRATQPIIEYDWDLELNEWTYTEYQWAYKAGVDDTFVDVEITPPTIEIEPINWWELAPLAQYPNGTTILLDYRYGDLTDYFTEGLKIYIGNSSIVGVYDVDYAEYKRDADGLQYRTFVTLTTAPDYVDGDLTNLKPSSFNIFPFNTTIGDVWQGYGTHWLMRGAKDPVPSPHRIDNPFTDIPTDAAWQIDIPEYEYRTSNYSQEFRLVVANGSYFELSENIPANDTRTLRRKSLFGYDDIRVYTSDLVGDNITRQFGSYEEVEEAVINILGIKFDTNEFFIPNDYAPFFAVGDTIVVSDNDTFGTMQFTITSVSASNRIGVSETIPLTATSTGVIHNTTLPLSSYHRPGITFTPDNNVTLYVMGINFLLPLQSGVLVIIEVGPASLEGLGSTLNRTRMIEDNDVYSVNGDIVVSKTTYRRVEQLKTKNNQYPLFDIFTTLGAPAYKANPIFGYRTSFESEVNINTGLRIVFDSINNVYDFDQFLLDEDNGELFAYRDYSSDRADFWYNPETSVLNFWAETEWSEKTTMSNFYRKAVISPIEPNEREKSINGLYWYNTTTDTLYRRFISGATRIWSVIKTIDTVITDKNLQTIWKAGTDDDLYIPSKVDWIRRTEPEYNAERLEFIKARTAELLLSDSSLTEQEAIAIASDEWLAQEANHLSESGEWIGDWEIPDPLYHNNLHENKKYLSTRELLTHFTTIIANQPVIPGYSGTADGMFNLLPMADVNYSLGGTIKEFNDGFDTFLSSVFINNVTPRSLIDFAHDQYESLLNSIKEIYRRNSLELLTNIEVDNILNLSDYVAKETISVYELNDQNAFVYGDTTTFTDVDGVNDLGVKNWIATLPYVNLIEKQIPTRTIDEAINLNEVVHHDGHRNSYALTPATIDVISQTVISSIDPRTNNKPLGKASDSLPPNNVNEFIAAYNTPITNREGVYWYHQPINNNSVLYRYVVVDTGDVTPSTSNDIGTLWMDLTPNSEVLRILQKDISGNRVWNIVDGLSLGDKRLHNGTDVSTATVSAWQVIDYNTLLNDTIFSLETKLYENVPDIPGLSYDLNATKDLNPANYEQYLEDAFLDYVSHLEIVDPFRNTEFSQTDPFTWNYKHSIQGGGTTIISADGETNSFLVRGNKVAEFDPCADSASCPSTFSFFVKNSGVNDGTWTTLVSTSTRFTTFYNAANDTTRIFVDGDVLDSLQGTIYSGVLPSPITETSPNNLNDGSESGGYWKDLYTKMYTTPYPNKEPWKLQGYIDKPTWWDVEYLNDDVNQWGNRTWKYKHGFEITGANNDSIEPGIPATTVGTFIINGNFFRNFLSGTVLTVDNSNDHNGSYIIGKSDTIIAVNPGANGTASIDIDDTEHLATGKYYTGMSFSIAEPTPDPLINILAKAYTIANVNHVGDTFTIIVNEEIVNNEITINSSFINAAVYDSLSNTTEIKLQGLVNSTTPSGRIVQAYGMWENIRNGIIPPNRKYPNEVLGITGKPYEDNLSGLSVPDLPTFLYFSVNIDNVDVSTDGGITSYAPDGILPPYWDYVSVYTSLPNNIDSRIRSIFYDFSTEIISPNISYVFGDAGTVEYNWRSSSQFLYDQLTVAYRLDPVRVVSGTFGFKYSEIAGLQIDRDVKNTPSHTRINFHGDVVNDKQFKSFGLNQWYVNYNRYNGYDANFSDFKELWTGWKAPLTYQFATFADTPSLSVGHRFVDITNFDYNIISKRSPGVDDMWLDALKVSIINVPPDLIRYDNENEWRFEIKTNLPSSRNLSYYDVHNYQFYANVSTDECWLYSWEIKSLDAFNKTFDVGGDQVHVFTSGSQFDIIGSTGNDKTYTVATSSFDVDANITSVLVYDNILSARSDGIIKADYRRLPWKTGDIVYLSTAETLPIPLVGDTVNGLTKLYIIKVSDTVFKLANTPLDAETNTPFDITTTGRGDQFVGQIWNTFNTVNSKNNWRTYAVDKSNILNITTPQQMQGMQTLVNTINGYDAYTNDQGWKINEDKSAIDPDSSDIVSWLVESQRFISYAYSQRSIRERVSDRYNVLVDETSEWTFKESNNIFITGDVVSVLSSNGLYPAPISRNIRYYMIRETLETFKLAATKQDADNGVFIRITSTTNVGDLQLTIPKNNVSEIPPFEINAFRRAIWLQPERGIVSNIITGPVTDIRTSQLIYNQKGERIDVDQLRVYRQDKETKIDVFPAANENDVNLAQINPLYNTLHLGGLHIFIDTYEHTMVLNNYTSEGNLLYDPFIGLNVTKYEMLFNKQRGFTHRPNVGGYYLETFFNQGANIKENIEASIENVRYAYDTFDTLESGIMTQYSRKALGYEGTTDYLTNLNLSQKSQFLFWRGQIQSKGSVNAVKAFINSRRFIDAKIDDFWAVKLGDFGTVKELEYPEMFATTVDARSNELRLEFIANEIEEPELAVDESFTPIQMSNQERWYNQPDQTKVLRDNGKILYFDMKPKNKVEMLLDGSPTDIISNSGRSYIKHDLDVDSVQITQFNSTTLLTETWKEDVDYVIINNNIIELINGTGNGSNITIWGMVLNHEGQSPARIIDRESETQISTIQFWDPARGIHYNNAIHNVDLQNPEDPAQYTDTLRTNLDYSGNWKDSFVGTTWLNTAKLSYVPYYSEQMFPDTTERFRNWGQLTDWSTYEIFEWVESDVPPTEWDALAASEEGDRTIVEYLRKSGIARQTILVPAPNSGSPINWIPANDIIKTRYPVIDASIINNSEDYWFVSAFDERSDFYISDFINVYINGKLYREGVSATDIATYIIPVADLIENVVVVFAQIVPTNQDDIDIEIEAGKMLQEYEYSKVKFFDELGIEFFKYYFWVQDKRTKPIDKNRTMPIIETAIQLNSIPSAHMFFQKVETPSIVATENETLLRTERHEYDGVSSTYPLALEQQPNTTLLVEINGRDLLDDNTMYTVSGSPLAVNILEPLVLGDVIKISYTGIFNHPIELPYRYTQAIVRGLQGTITADNRYTIRFTRNFTLRDELNTENEAVGEFDIKSLHTEWKIFRQEQQYNIDKWMWDRITESIVGFKLTDPLVRVPAYERQLYDEKFNTDTQYGLGDGQSFANGSLALNSIISYLLDPDVDFNPIDINVFFANNNFETSESIIKAMDEIYNTFIFTNINRMFFSVLKDAFTTKAKYPGILKTSMVSLHGIRPFQTNGVFDD